MKVFIWQYANKVSDSYHEGGGLVVIANSEAEARGRANSEPGVELAEDEAPDFVIECADTEPKVFIFPDAGCC